ncbi:hypothetical protein RND81_07G157300 [Saponaria officinalis]|uniref:RNA ligase/cyclic nucleotide phosphodiesterase family protein n=1 Tax=Saponaria officinalis TaxID=3572 RepID=A0AAW1JRD7_SAPOF
MTTNDTEKHAPFAIWAVPSEDVKDRIEIINRALREEFGGPKLDPHLTVVGMTSLTRADALKRFNAACRGLKAYPAHTKGVSIGSSFWQCVYVLLDTNPEVMEASAHCRKHFGYTSDMNTPYMPHMSLLYANLTNEEKQKALEKANALDDQFGDLGFTIDRLELWITDANETLSSWEKVDEFHLQKHCH